MVQRDGICLEFLLSRCLDPLVFLNFCRFLEFGLNEPSQVLAKVRDRAGGEGNRDRILDVLVDDHGLVTEHSRFVASFYVGEYVSRIVVFIRFNCLFNCIYSHDRKCKFHSARARTRLSHKDALSNYCVYDYF